jgi:hypothetical protein
VFPLLLNAHSGVVLYPIPFARPATIRAKPLYGSLPPRRSYITKADNGVFTGTLDTRHQATITLQPKRRQGSELGSRLHCPARGYEIGVAWELNDKVGTLHFSRL